jgi:radical SAM superfamily enzyme YgiQ (UPF0313 family)
VDLLLLIPPFTQPNAPHAAVPGLTGFLRGRGHRVRQSDVGFDVLLRLYARAGLRELFAEWTAGGGFLPASAERVLAYRDAWIEAIDPVMAFLCGKDGTAAARIAAGGWLPPGPRSAAAAEPAGPDPADRARRLATAALEDLADAVRDTIAPDFGFARYGEERARSARRFDALAEALARPPNLLERWLADRVGELLGQYRPGLVGISAPFPGTVLGALRAARAVKEHARGTPVVLGGGYCGTELRETTEPRLFDFVDFVTLDAGERPLLCLLEHLAGRRARRRLCRTLVRRGRRVVRIDGAAEPDVPFAEVGVPVHDGLRLDERPSLVEVPNRVRRLWSDGTWLRLALAHGCYWRRCTFCDATLPYVGRYEPAPVDVLADRIEAMVAETGRRGFHFVDEAAPPAVLRGLALRLLERAAGITWWANVRLERAFDPDTCRLLAASGCVAITGGLEAPSDRLLRVLGKGITLSEGLGAIGAFAAAGIGVHLYLMYGVPGETARETVEGLETVRRLFAAGWVQSAFWHRFVLTAHSAMARDPRRFGLRIVRRGAAPFASNDRAHVDGAGADPDRFAEGLEEATWHYLHGAGLRRDVRDWFGGRVPAPRLRSDLPDRAEAERTRARPIGERGRLVWLGGEPSVTWLDGRARLVVRGREGEAAIRVSAAGGAGLADLLRSAMPARAGGRYPERAALGAAVGADPERFVRGPAGRRLRRLGLVVV